jgi:hypothetical protein
MLTDAAFWITCCARAVSAARGKRRPRAGPHRVRGQAVGQLARAVLVEERDLLPRDGAEQVLAQRGNKLLPGQLKEPRAEERKDGAEGQHSHQQQHKADELALPRRTGRETTKTACDRQ